VGRQVIVHVYSEYGKPDPETKRRLAVAKSTWACQRWQDCPVPDASLPRLFTEEGKSLPFIRDLFDAGCQGQDDSAIVVYTNTDICVHSQASLIIAEAMQETDACYAYRRDLDRIDAPIPDDQIVNARWYCGRDLYAFRAGWWRFYRLRMPDMLIAREMWDPTMGQLMDETNAGPTVLPDIIYHERHGAPAGYWEDASNRYRLRGQIHNLTLGVNFFRQRGIDPQKYGVPSRVAASLTRL
jgi:hypothetical protein